VILALTARSPIRSWARFCVPRLHQEPRGGRSGARILVAAGGRERPLPGLGDVGEAVLLVHFEVYRNRGEALEAAGLRE
jgi:hypothetical protein